MIYNIEKLNTKLQDNLNRLSPVFILTFQTKHSVSYFSLRDHFRLFVSDLRRAGLLRSYVAVPFRSLDCCWMFSVALNDDFEIAMFRDYWNRRTGGTIDVDCVTVNSIPSVMNLMRSTHDYDCEIGFSRSLKLEAA